jgi:hypothetical protein
MEDGIKTSSAQEILNQAPQLSRASMLRKNATTSHTFNEVAASGVAAFQPRSAFLTGMIDT